MREVIIWNLPILRLQLKKEHAVVLLFYYVLCSASFSFLAFFQSSSLICCETEKMNPEGETMILNLEDPVSIVSFAASCLAL